MIKFTIYYKINNQYLYYYPLIVSNEEYKNIFLYKNKFINLEYLYRPNI
jgi:hypothetical protein